MFNRFHVGFDFGHRHRTHNRYDERSKQCSDYQRDETLPQADRIMQFEERSHRRPRDVQTPLPKPQHAVRAQKGKEVINPTGDAEEATDISTLVVVIATSRQSIGQHTLVRCSSNLNFSCLLMRACAKRLKLVICPSL